MEPRVIRNLLAVKEALAIQPKSFDMYDWCSPKNGPCGTTLCIAGHYAFLAGVAVNDIRSYTTDLDESGAFSSLISRDFNADISEIELFYADDWPRELWDRYLDGNRVKAAQAAIDWYIAKQSTPAEIAAATAEQPELAHSSTR